MMSPSDEVEEVLSKTMEEYSFIILGLIVSPPRCNITETYSCGLPVRKQPLYGFKEKYFKAVTPRRAITNTYIYLYYSLLSLRRLWVRSTLAAPTAVRGRCAGEANC